MQSKSLDHRPDTGSRRGAGTASTSRVATPPVLAVRPEQAAAMLGVSRDTFDREIRHELRSVRVGRLHLYPVKELERFVSLHASRPLDEDIR
jgi:excisionase family DNA binding protein